MYVHWFCFLRVVERPEGIDLVDGAGDLRGEEIHAAIEGRYCQALEREWSLAWHGISNFSVSYWHDRLEKRFSPLFQTYFRGHVQYFYYVLSYLCLEIHIDTNYFWTWHCVRFVFDVLIISCPLLSSKTNWGILPWELTFILTMIWIFQMKHLYLLRMWCDIFTIYEQLTSRSDDFKYVSFRVVLLSHTPTGHVSHHLRDDLRTLLRMEIRRGFAKQWKSSHTLKTPAKMRPKPTGLGTNLDDLMPRSCVAVYHM